MDDCQNERPMPELLTFPEPVGASDIDYVADAPATWSEDYRAMWVDLQVCKRNKIILHKYAKRLHTQRQADQQRIEGLILQKVELVDALKDLMQWQVKNVKKWNNPAYDNAHRVVAKTTGEQQ